MPFELISSCSVRGVRGIFTRTASVKFTERKMLLRNAILNKLVKSKLITIIKGLRKRMTFYFLISKKYMRTILEKLNVKGQIFVTFIEQSSDQCRYFKKIE